MTIWVDAQLSPALARWIKQKFGFEAQSVRELGLLHADDRLIFDAAKQAGAVVLTKDRDFVNLLEQFGPPPQVIWLTCGNTSERHLRQVLETRLGSVMVWLERGEPLVEISG